ncbi:MAG TPA: dihydrofolate reductase family protein, partial [Myxococcota bacterium]
DVVVAQEQPHLAALAARCEALVAPFSSALVDGRAFTVLKIAASLDGRVARAPPMGPGRADRTVTGLAARALVHRLRDAVDAVIVGAGTVAADDPALTVRDVPGRDPLRVVVDAALRTATDAHVYAGDRRAIAVHTSQAPPDRVAAFDAAGIERLALGQGARVDVAALLRALAPRGVASALVEAGPGLAGAFVGADLVDELWWLSAPVVFGGRALPALVDGADGADDAEQRFFACHRVTLGQDALAVLTRAEQR